jgi:PAS domain S-box-containing protein
VIVTVSEDFPVAASPHALENFGTPSVRDESSHDHQVASLSGEAKPSRWETPLDQANSRTKQAEARTAQANSRADQADLRTEEANTRIEHAEARNVQALLESGISYRRLFETAQDGILILDAGSGQVVDANPFMKALLGYSQEEFVGRKLWEIGPFKGEAASKVAFAELQLQDRLRYEGLPLETKDGRRVEVEFISSAYLEGTKRLIQCNIRDTTERRQAERTAVRLAAIVESSEDAIIGKDLDGIIQSWNGGAQKIFGYSAAEMVGQPITALIPPGRLEEEQQILGKINRGESVRHFDTVRQAKNGEQIDVSVTVSPIKIPPERSSARRR